MIRIIYNRSNSVVMPLDANATLTSPYYLFEIYSEMQNEIVKTFVSLDVATTANRARYNEFNFVEVGYNGVEDLYGGRIRLLDGTYLLKAYEQNSSGNITVSGVPIFQDVLKVYGNPIQGTYQDYTGQDTDFTQYTFLE